MWGRREAPRPVKPREPARHVETPRPIAAPPSVARAIDAPRATETPQTLATTDAAPVTAPVVSTLSRLTRSLTIHGQITGQDDLYIDGQVSGKIRVAGGKLTVGPNGRVDSDIESREIEVHGQAQGLLRAAERVFLGRTANAAGDIVAPRVVIEDGASFTGRVEVLRLESAGEAKKTEVNAVRVASSGASASSAKVPAGTASISTSTTNQEAPRAVSIPATAGVSAGSASASTAEASAKTRE